MRAEALNREAGNCSAASSVRHLQAFLLSALSSSRLTWWPGSSQRRQLGAGCSCGVPKGRLGLQPARCLGGAGIPGRAGPGRELGEGDRVLRPRRRPPPPGRRVRGRELRHGPQRRRPRSAVASPLAPSSAVDATHHDRPGRPRRPQPPARPRSPGPDAARAGREGPGGAAGGVLASGRPAESMGGTSPAQAWALGGAISSEHDCSLSP